MGASRLVYSTDRGPACPVCRQPAERCACRPEGSRAAGGVVRVRRERKGRGGKTVTAISGVPEEAASIKRLAAELKRRCGSGGTVRDGVIEIQGDHAQALLEDLRARGYSVKQSGG